MGQKVLVFESDPTFAADLRNELTKLGCSVQVVDDGNAGLQQATSARPDLILLSIELPRMNGFSVCNKLKKDPSLKDVPLIIMSSESSDETFEQHRKLRTRAEDYVHKPITFDDLLARIQPFVPLQSGNGGAAAEDYRAPQETSADEAEADHPTGHPPARSSDAPEEIDNGDIVIEEMPSQRPGARRSARPPVAGDVVERVNGTAPLDAALRAVSEAPIPRTSDRPARISTRPPPADDGAAQLAAGLQRDVEAAQAKIRDLEEALDHARAEAASAAENAGSVDTGEVERLRKDNEDLKTRLVAAGTAGAAGAKGGMSSRDFLDLREALNKKDKETLSLREVLAKKDKEIVDVRDKSLAFERLKADLDDKVLEQERELAERQDKVDSLQADKEQAKKAGEDFKRRAERALVETEAAKKELAELREKQGAELAAREADIATLKDEHAQNVEIERKARQDALAEVEARRVRELEEAAAEKQAALEEAQQIAAAAAAEATAAAAEATAAREKALTGEHEAKLATLHRAHQDEAQRLRSEHQQKVEALGKQHEEAAAQVASKHEAGLVDLREELESERDGRVAEAEARSAAELAAVRAEAAEKIAAVEREAAEKTAAAEREASEKVAAAEREASEKTAAFEKDFAEKIAALEKDAAEKIAAAQAAGAARALAAEEDAAQKIRAAEEHGATRTEAAERDAAERIARAEEQAAAAKTASDAQIAGLEDDLAATRSKASTYETRVTELEAAFASTTEAKSGFERDLEAAKQRVAILEADLAATRYSLDETKGHLVTQTNRLDKATTKIEADKTSLDRAKDALAVALSQIEEAESRTA